MVVTFNGKELESCCTQQGKARKRYGLANETKLLRIMTIIVAAETLLDVRRLQPRSHWLDGSRSHQVAIPLADAKRLIVEPHEFQSREWETITSIKVIEITDYHK